MLIDWFTVIAQTLNFLILVWLMKRYLYKPILHAIDQREKLIAAELADADAKKAEARKERDEFQYKNDEFDRQRAALMNQATDEAQVEQQRLLDEARKTADALRAKGQESLKNDALNLHQAIRRRTQQEVFAISRKVLMDLAGTTLEERMLALFLSRLTLIQGEEKEQLLAAIKATQHPVVVRTTFGLSPERSASTEAALQETLGSELQVRFETAPELISGIELVTDGHKVAWSIADYLRLMETSIAGLLDNKDKPGTEAELAPEAQHGA
jgi:F-type H+-transporting ATPase subunit b